MGIIATEIFTEFANVLEQLETQFYTQALQKFQESDFIAAGFTSAQVPIQQFQAIQSDEASHTTVLAVGIYPYVIDRELTRFLLYSRPSSRWETPQ